MGKVIEYIFQKVYLAMLGSGIFLLLSLCGGFVLGLAPASCVLMTLFAEHGYRYQDYKFKEAWSLFKASFVRSNQVFYTIASLEALLLYGIYLLLHIKPSVMTSGLMLCNLFLLLFFSVSYAIYLKLQAHFEMSYRVSLTLSIIGLFTNLLAVVKVLIGTVLLFVVSYYAPALAFFVLIGLWHFYISDVLQPVFEMMESRI